MSSFTPLCQVVQMNIHTIGGLLDLICGCIHTIYKQDCLHRELKNNHIDIVIWNSHVAAINLRFIKSIYFSVVKKTKLAVFFQLFILFLTISNYFQLFFSTIYIRFGVFQMKKLLLNKMTSVTKSNIWKSTEKKKKKKLLTAEKF